MTPPRISSYIDGVSMEGVAAPPAMNPANPMELVAEVGHVDAAATSAAIEAADRAFMHWSTLPAPARGQLLARAGDILRGRADRVAADLAREEGKVLSEARGEVLRAADILGYFASQTLEPDGDTYPSHDPRVLLLMARREPLGVVSVITPWNFPIAIPAWKIAPALAYGNTVVWKPAATVSLTARHLLDCLIEAGLPRGVLNLVLGKGRQLGDVLCSHPAVRAVTFTGSNVVGAAVAEIATRGGKKVQVEMGGKNAAIVLADADLELAVREISRGAFGGTGQKCTATSRVLVAKEVADDFTEQLVAEARLWTVGDPLLPTTRMGPLASADQLTTVSRYLNLAEKDGGVRLGGDSIPGTGYFVAPTVITGLRRDSVVMREEIFGPVVATQRFGDADEALDLANDGFFGLTAAIFTQNLDAALGLGRRIRAGVVKINQETSGVEFHVPFGGMRDSSYGPREQGKGAREFYTQWRTTYVASGSA